jgi:hypothetical protein
MSVYSPPAPPKKSVGHQKRSQKIVGREYANPTTTVVASSSPRTEPLQPFSDSLLEARWKNLFSLAKKDPEVASWYQENQAAVKKIIHESPSDTTLKPANIQRDTATENFQEHPWDRALDGSLPSGDLSNLLQIGGNKSSVCTNVGYLGKSQHEGKPRRPGPKDWWIFDREKLKEFFEHAKASGWDMQQLAFVVWNYYLCSESDDDCSLWFGMSENAAKQYRYRLVNLGCGMFGLRPNDSVSEDVDDIVIEYMDTVIGPSGAPEEHLIRHFPWRWGRDHEAYVRWLARQPKPPKPGGTEK